MQFEAGLEEPEAILFAAEFVAKWANPFAVAITSGAIYLPTKKRFAIGDPWYLRHVPIGQEKVSSGFQSIGGPALDRSSRTAGSPERMDVLEQDSQARLFQEEEGAVPDQEAHPHRDRRDLQSGQCRNFQALFHRSPRGHV